MPCQYRGQLRELARRVVHRLTRDSFAFARGVEYVWRERRHLGRRGGCGPAHQVVEVLEAERSQQARQQGGPFAPSVLGSRGGVERAPAEPIAAALVAQLPTVPAGAVQLASGAPRVGDRAGTRVDEDSG